jgi:ribonuclease HII
MPLFPGIPSERDPVAFDEGFRCAVGGLLAGVDEAGRGPLAGPVVAAAVILPEGCRIEGVRDSKSLSARMREEVFERIRCRAVAIGVGVVEPDEIDRINILQAALRAMREAVHKLHPRPAVVLVDGPRGIGLDLPQIPVVKGDARSQSIAAASVIAKVTRDRMMRRYHELYPQYGFDRHMGYATRYHLEALRKHGFCPIHRRSFRGVRGMPENTLLSGVTAPEDGSA